MWIRQTTQVRECVVRIRVCKSETCKHKAKTVERFQDATEDAYTRRVMRVMRDVVDEKLRGYSLFKNVAGAPSQPR
jgi:hypothetical protein